LYASLTSSGVSWGEKVSNKTLKVESVLKPFAYYKIAKIEQAYHKYLKEKNESNLPMKSSLSSRTSFSSNYSISDSSFNCQKETTNVNHNFVSIGDEEYVDFDKSILKVGKKEIHMERQYPPCLYAIFFSSPTQINLQLIISKLQIDNQLYDTPFPVLFSKVLPPKSVALTDSNFLFFIFFENA
jgi:hypothetical protein